MQLSHPLFTCTESKTDFPYCVRMVLEISEIIICTTEHYHCSLSPHVNYIYLKPADIINEYLFIEFRSNSESY